MRAGIDREEAGDRGVRDARSGAGVGCTGEADRGERKGENREAGRERRVCNERAGEHDSV
jgi:hypothetical protein